MVVGVSAKLTDVDNGRHPAAPSPPRAWRSALPAVGLEQQICAAAVRLVARWGIRKTTIGDIAKEAGCSRATVYRAFPGGKTELLLAAAAGEHGALLEGVADRAAGAVDGESALVAVITFAAHSVSEHGGFQFVLAHEPDIVLPLLGFGEQDRLYAQIAELIGPHLEPFFGGQAGWAAEWGARAVLSYEFNPSPVVSLTDEADTRRIVRQFLLPALSRFPSAHA